MLILLTIIFLYANLLTMKVVLTIILCCFFLNGCAATKVSEKPSRYASITKQEKYVSVKFDFDQTDLVGKTKSEVRTKMGPPEDVLKIKISGNSLEERWIYFPKGTNNFIAIIICFDGDKVSSASYESVM
ncbi:MAG: hypothetical protein HY810_05585 [Candidatus Omnitrophica bacterium]|nr:hypothetical protein [Candidatus Omnitrophota bacterium]